MKKIPITTLLLGVVAIVFSARPATAPNEDIVTIKGLSVELAPYGGWIDCSKASLIATGPHDQRVATRAGFRPDRKKSVRSDQN